MSNDPQEKPPPHILAAGDEILRNLDITQKALNDLFDKNGALKFNEDVPANVSQAIPTPQPTTRRRSHFTPPPLGGPHFPGLSQSTNLDTKEPFHQSHRNNPLHCCTAAPLLPAPAQRCIAAAVPLPLPFCRCAAATATAAAPLPLPLPLPLRRCPLHRCCCHFTTAAKPLPLSQRCRGAAAATAVQLPPLRRCYRGCRPHAPLPLHRCRCPLHRCCRCCRPCAAAAALLPLLPLPAVPLPLPLLPLPLRRCAAGCCAAAADAPMCPARPCAAVRCCRCAAPLRPAPLPPRRTIEN
jgi:hypothetical protein